MVEGGGEIGRLHRWALLSYRRLPARVRVALIRLVAPSHTVGAVCFVEHAGRILVLRQHHRPGWTLPGGLIDRGETAEQAVVRELREETGLEIDVGLPLGVVVEPRSRRVDVIFHVTAPGLLDVRAGSEAVEAAWMSPDALGEVDEPTAQVLDVWRRSLHPEAHSGRVRPA